MLISEQEYTELREAVMALCGMNGQDLIDVIAGTGMCPVEAYTWVADNIRYNDRRSVVKYFGLIQWYYLQWLDAKDENDLKCSRS